MNKNRIISVFVKLGLIEKTGNKQKKMSELSLARQLILVLGTTLLTVVQMKIIFCTADYVADNSTSVFSLLALFAVILTILSTLVCFIALFVLFMLVFNYKEKSVIADSRTKKS
jgi:hypothetical protein